MNTADAKRVLETALICSQQPLPVRELRVLFDDELGADTIKALLARAAGTTGRSAASSWCSVASGWRFQSRPEMRDYLDRLHPEKPPRYTRAVLETLAIIAYRQPVTRGDMEDIRGVTINALILKQLEDRGWVEVIGHREAAGRPALYATTRQFLDDLGLASLDQLPLIETPAQQGALIDALAEAAQTSPCCRSRPAGASARRRAETERGRAEPVAVAPASLRPPIPRPPTPKRRPTRPTPPPPLPEPDHEPHDPDEQPRCRPTPLPSARRRDAVRAAEGEAAPRKRARKRKAAPAGRGCRAGEPVELAAGDRSAGGRRRGRPSRSRRPRSRRGPGDEAEDDDEDEPDDEEDDPTAPRRAAEREQRNAPPPEPIRFADVVSGQFDADEESPEVPPPKRVLLPEADTPKLHKVLAQAGLGSRLRDGAADPAGPDHGQRRAGPHRPAHPVRRPGQGQRQADPLAHRAAAGARHRVPQAGRRGRHPRRSAEPARPCSASCRGCSRASGSRSAGSTSTPKACCCSPTRASWPTS